VRRTCATRFWDGREIRSKLELADPCFDAQLKMFFTRCGPKGGFMKRRAITSTAVVAVVVGPPTVPDLVQLLRLGIVRSEFQ
jgi:hypothetical protein